MGQAAESVPDGAVWLQTSMVTGVERVAGLAEDNGITFVDCPVIGATETAKQGRLVVLASGPGDALDWAQPKSSAPSASPRRARWARWRRSASGSSPGSRRR
jgi:3-hydroxyisobutyrate dehydrogenase-like beta-hydroxyacid dehydrogenase